MLLLSILAIISVLLVASPTRMMTLIVGTIAPTRDVAPVVAGPDVAGPAVAGPDVPAPDSVTDVVATASDPQTLDPSAGTGAATTQGRWGTTPARPQAPGILIEELRGGWRVEGGNEEAAALAVIAAHAWVDALRRTAGVDAGDDGGRATGVIVAVEAVERPGAHHAVVTTLVAPAGADGALLRLAFPMTFDTDGPALAGRPWTLPSPAAVGVGSPTTIAGTAVGDLELIAAARKALDDIGLPGDRLIALEATDGWPFIARLDDGAQGHPWLRWHLDRFVVAGLPLARTGSAPP
jgi:hypothetical protein